jgi:hypothetical protein
VLEQSEHFLVRAKIGLEMKRSEKTKKSEIKKWDIGKLNKKAVKEEFIKEITANLQNTLNHRILPFVGPGPLFILELTQIVDVKYKMKITFRHNTKWNIFLALILTVV